MLPNKNNILEKFKLYCDIDFNPQDVSFSSNSNYCVLRIITKIEVLVLNYNYSKDHLKIDLFNFKDINLIDEILKGFNFKEINDNFKKIYKEYNINTTSNFKVEYILISNFLNDNYIKRINIVYSLKYKKYKININVEELNFNINFIENDKTIYLNKKSKNYYQIFEFIFFRICFKEKYNLTRFTQKNLDLIKLMNY